MDDIYGRSAIRKALKAWHDGRQLGRHPLARQPAIHAWRLQQGYRDSDAGRGLALREQLQKAIDSLRPDEGEPDPAGKAWRPFLILTEQFVNGRSPQWVAAQLHVAKRTYHREQRRALERLAAYLQQLRARAPAQELPPFLAPPRINRPFIGRDALVERLVTRLTAGEDRLALHGLPGVGKTSLLLEVAHHPDIRDHFDGGVLWAGLGQQPDLLLELGRWAQALSAPASAVHQAQTLPARAQLVHDALSNRRALLVIDDAWTLEAALAFRLGGAHSAQLLSTRLPNVAHDFAGDGAVPVAEFDTVAGAALLGAYRIDLDNQAVHQLVDRVGGLPLGLHLVGRYLRRTGAQGVDDVLGSAATRLQLSKPQPPLTRHPDLPPGASQSLHNTIDLTVGTLPPDTQEALAALSCLLPKPTTFPQEAAVAVTGLALEHLLDLVEAGLVEHIALNRYAVHQTIHDVASQLPLPAGAAGRYIDWAVAYAEAQAKDDEAIDDELDNLLHALEAAQQLGDAGKSIRVAIALDPLLTQRSRFALADRHLSAAAALCDEATEPRLVAQLKLRQSANARIRGFPTAARDLAGEAQAISHQHGLARLEADAWHELCMALTDLGETEAALTAGERARDQYEALNAATALSKVGSSLGLIYLQRGDLTAAEGAFEGMVAAARRSGDRTAEGKSLHNLALVSYQRAAYQPAEEVAELALALFRADDNKSSEGQTLALIGAIYGNQGLYEQAINTYRRALALAQEVGDLSVAHTMSNLAANTRLLLRLDEAEEYARRAIQLSQQTQRKRDEASATIRLTQILADREEFEAAREAGLRALALAREIREWWYEVEILAELGWLELAAGDDQLAGDYFRKVLEMQPEPRYGSLWIAAHAELARLALQAGDTPAARQHIERLFTFQAPDVALGARSALVCYEACVALGDERASTILAVNTEALLRLADHISNAGERRAFLEEQPTHRALLGYLAQTAGRFQTLQNRI